MPLSTNPIPVSIDADSLFRMEAIAGRRSGVAGKAEMDAEARHRETLLVLDRIATALEKGNEAFDTVADQV